MHSDRSTEHVRIKINFANIALYFLNQLYMCLLIYILKNILTITLPIINKVIFLFKIIKL